MNKICHVDKRRHRHFHLRFHFRPHLHAGTGSLFGLRCCARLWQPAIPAPPPFRLAITILALLTRKNESTIIMSIEHSAHTRDVNRRRILPSQCRTHAATTAITRSTQKNQKTRKQKNKEGTAEGMMAIAQSSKCARRYCWCVL